MHARAHDQSAKGTADSPSRSGLGQSSQGDSPSSAPEDEPQDRYMAQVARPTVPPSGGGLHHTPLPSLRAVFRGTNTAGIATVQPSVGDPPLSTTQTSTSTSSSSSSSTQSVADRAADTPQAGPSESKMPEASPRPPLWQSRHPTLTMTRPSGDSAVRDEAGRIVHQQGLLHASGSRAPQPGVLRSTSLSSSRGSSQGLTGVGMSRAASETSMASAEDERGRQSGSPPAGEEQDGTKKRTRALMTFVQSQHLKALWRITKFPSTEERERVAQEVGLTPRQVQVWFQNHRQSARKAMTENRGIPPGEDPADYAVLQMSPRSRRMTQNAYEERLAHWTMAPGGSPYGGLYDSRDAVRYGYHAGPSTMASAPALGLSTRAGVAPLGRPSRIEYADHLPEYRSYPSPYLEAQQGHRVGAPPIRFHDDTSLLHPDRANTINARVNPYGSEYRSRLEQQRSPNIFPRRAGSEEPLYRVQSTPNPSFTTTPSIKPMHLPPSLNKQVLSRPLEGSMPAEFASLSPGQVVRGYESNPAAYAHSRDSTSSSSKMTEVAPGGEAMWREGSQSGVPAGQYGAPGAVMESPKSDKLPGISSILNSID